MSKPRTRLAVIFGGRSAEHDVSVRSAEGVLGALDRARYEPVLVPVARGGGFLRAPGAETAVDALHSGVPETDFSALLGGCAAALPLIHGTTGEDGCLQGLLECLGVPYVGSGVFASSLCMDKGHLKRWLQAEGLPVGPYAMVDRAADARTLREVLSTGLACPLFVKPANLGSSVGITRVESPDALSAAVTHAGLHDRRVIIEQGVNAREIEVAILDDGEHPALVSDVAEIVLPAGRWYDYETKYESQAAKLKLPADLDADTRQRTRELALRTFRSVGARGLARVDFFLNRDTGELLVNEVNTLPGFTSVSMYPRLIEHAGVSYAELITRLVEQALARR